MRPRPALQAFSLGLAILLTVAGLQPASARSCVDEDCSMPCCDRDGDRQTVIPVFPCCRTVSVDQAAPRSPSTTLESDRSLVAAPAVAFGAAHSMVATTNTTRVFARHLPAPPLYQRHCALLL